MRWHSKDSSREVEAYNKIIPPNSATLKMGSPLFTLNRRLKIHDYLELLLNALKVNEFLYQLCQYLHWIHK